MIKIIVYQNKQGVLEKIIAQGHSDLSCKGTDIVCASVTTLLRTAIAFLGNKNTITLHVEKVKRGELFIFIEKYTNEDMAILIFTADFIKIGLEQLMQEYPENVNITIERFG